MNALDKLRDGIFLSDNKACFIERDRILASIEKLNEDKNAPDYFQRVFARVLDNVSTPVNENDYFVGRVVEGLPDEGIASPNTLLLSTGHMSYNYEKILKIGLDGILSEINENANRLGDEKSKEYAENAKIVIDAISRFMLRYADEAEKYGKTKCADALRLVSHKGANDYFSALQFIWMLHMIASCYMGSRDYAFGRFDQFMYPYYKEALENGATRNELTELLAGFFVKTDEICGRGTWNFEPKPVLPQASKQYINIGGEKPNEFSQVVLDAAVLLNLAQPQITVLLKPEADKSFTQKVFESMAVVVDSLHVYNYELIKKALMNKGIPEDVASDYTFSACCTFDLNYRNIREEYYSPSVPLLCEALNDRDYSSVEDILKVYSEKFKKNIEQTITDMLPCRDDLFAKMAFAVDSLFISECNNRCRSILDGGLEYRVFNVFIPGIATIGDSLAAIDKIVFKQKRFSYKEFMDIVNSNYNGNEELRLELINMTKFGNDTEYDKYAVMAGKYLLDAIDELKFDSNVLIAPGFYSLEREISSAIQIGATPDGRKAGEAFSENQSPVYGGDKNGITALLKSLASLPFNRTVTGGLNLTFSRKIDENILSSLVLSYFKMGGFHVGITVLDREKLKDAMVNPEKYKSLTVRLYGFSEYFISLPKWQQEAVLNRTEY